MLGRRNAEIQTLALLRANPVWIYHCKMEPKNTHGGARPGGGRKRIKPGVETVPVMVKMTVDQKAKLQRLGGASWVRARIDKARDPESSE